MASRKQAYFEYDDYSDGYSDDPLDDDYWGEEDGDDGSHQEPEVIPPPKKQPIVPPKSKMEQMKTAKATEKLATLSVKAFTIDPQLKRLCDQAAEDERSAGKKTSLSLVVLGHVDAGKSTTLGRLLYETGVVSDREVAKAQKDAKDIGKASFAWAWMLDERPEERTRGVTVDVALARFETPSKYVALLDAPGHRDFVPNMITGAAQADAALVIVDGSEGGFESGMRGQTLEHVQLAINLGIEHIAVVVTKLDTLVDAGRSEARYVHIREEMEDFMVRCGFKDVARLQWTIAVGLTGDNLVAPPTLGSLVWFRGRTLLDTIDSFQPPIRDVEAPLRLSVSEASAKGSKNVVISGKVHQGAMQAGTKVVLVPSGEAGVIKSLSIDSGRGTPKDCRLSFARAGDTVEATVTVSDPSVVHVGSVMCSQMAPIEVSERFVAQILVLDITIPLLHGQNLTLHAHAARTTGVLTKILSIVDEHTGEVTKERPRCLLKGQSAVVEITPTSPMPLETFDGCKALARVAVRDGGKTVAVGKILKTCRGQ
jgi:elongation factor 1 alpha-like protein